MFLEISDIRRDISNGYPPGKLTTYLLNRQWLPIGDLDCEDESDGEPVFVLPDLHLLSGNRHYKDFFHLNSERQECMIWLLRRLVEMRAWPEYCHMRVLQIGDFHDLWRERMHWWGEAVGAMLDRQLEAHRELFQWLAELGCERLIGNHDDKLAQKGVLERLRAHPISAYFPPSSIHPNRLSLARGVYSRIDLMHGHEHDSAEQPWWRRLINPVGCRFADPRLGIGETDEWRHEVVPDGTPDQMLEQPNLVYEPGSEPSEEKEKGQEFYADLAGKYDTCPADASDDLKHRQRSAVVIGHTHHPRIVEGGHPGDFVLVDCGSWVNQSSALGQERNQNLTIWNSQLGILSGPWAAVVQIGMA